MTQPQPLEPAQADPRVGVAANAIGWELANDGRPRTPVPEGIDVSAEEAAVYHRAARRVVAHLDEYAAMAWRDLAEQAMPRHDEATMAEVLASPVLRPLVAAVLRWAAGREAAELQETARQVAAGQVDL